MLVTQSCLTPCNSIYCSPPGSSVRSILQARILEWVATSFSRGSSRHRIEPVSPVAPAGRFFTTEPWGMPSLFKYQQIKNEIKRERERNSKDSWKDKRIWDPIRNGNHRLKCVQGGWLKRWSSSGGATSPESRQQRRRQAVDLRRSSGCLSGIAEKSWMGCPLCFVALGQASHDRVLASERRDNILPHWQP